MPRGTGANRQRGEGGGKCIQDQAEHKGSWYTMVMITDCIIDEIDMPRTIDADVVYPGKLLIAGRAIFGNVRRIKLTSGAMHLLDY